MSIKPGETDAEKRTVRFSLYDKRGLIATGGGDPDYEGNAYPGSPTLEYEHDIDEFVPATGTFGTCGPGQWFYTFSLDECRADRTEATIAVRIDGGVDFERQVVRVPFGKGIQPGETVARKRRIWLTMFRATGELANGGANAYYEGALMSGPTVEYAHNLGAYGPAGGTLSPLHGHDEWYYDPTDAETALALAKGTIAVKVAAAGCRTNIVRVGFGESSGGDDVRPTITVVSPIPGVPPGDVGGFPIDRAAASATPIVLDVGDLVPGVVYFAVVARFYVDAEGADPVEEVVFRRGQFRGLYVRDSSSAPNLGINGLRLTVRRSGGWPLAKGRPFIAFAIDAVDASGNLAS